MKLDKRIDAKLVKAYQSGNKEALAALVRRWHLTFCNKAFWIVKDKDLSKDIAQDTWQTIIAKIENLKETNSFASWALRIVYSKSLDVLRNQNAEQLKQQAYAKDKIENITEDNDQSSILKKKLFKAIQDLPVKQQTVIKLFYVECYSLNEISIILNVAEGTVKSRLFISREKLKTILKNNNYEK